MFRIPWPMLPAAIAKYEQIHIVAAGPSNESCRGKLNRRYQELQRFRDQADFAFTISHG